jgi:hypothetical protein
MVIRGKLENVEAISLNFLNITLSCAIRHMLAQSFLDVEDALEELLSTCSILLNRRRSYVAITSLECRLRVLLLLTVELKRSLRSIDNSAARFEPSPVVSRYVFLILPREL